MRTTSLTLVAIAGLIAAACVTETPIPMQPQGGSGGTGTGGAGTGTGGLTGSGGTTSVGSTGGSGMPGGTGGSDTMGGSGGMGSTGSGGMPPAGTGGTMGGSGGRGGMGGGMLPSGTGGTMGGGGGGGASGGPYAPRTGSFKMLVYSQVCCGAYAHDSRAAGRKMLQDIGTKQGFEVVLATDDSQINPTGLAQYEIVFFLNSTGDLWQSGTMRRDYETWIRKNGAYAGMHGATDSASSWTFYKELTGQYYDVHDNGVVSGTIQWTTAGMNHVVGMGLPNPWNRQEEWYRFNSWQTWSAKPGFTVLNTVTTTAGGTRPVSYVREWENIRAFYTSLGHADAPYTDPTVIKHVTAGIMWAVRREHLIKP